VIVISLADNGDQQQFLIIFRLIYQPVFTNICPHIWRVTLNSFAVMRKRITLQFFYFACYLFPVFRYESVKKFSCLI